MPLSGNTGEASEVTGTCVSAAYPRAILEDIARGGYRSRAVSDRLAAFDGSVQLWEGGALREIRSGVFMMPPFSPRGLSQSRRE